MCFSIRSCGVSVVSSVPWSMIATRSHTAWASSIEWVVRTMLPPVLAQLFDPRPELPARLRIEAGRRLVEQEQDGLVHDRDVQRETLLLPARQLLERLGRFTLEPDHGKPVGDRHDR